MTLSLSGPFETKTKLAFSFTTSKLLNLPSPQSFSALIVLIPWIGKVKVYLVSWYLIEPPLIISIYLPPSTLLSILPVLQFALPNNWGLLNDFKDPGL